jgi:uncharacterized protein YyaL (SSP411 family)
MEEESFEDPRVAALMNEGFVSILVDREERPDLDRHFIGISRTISGTGGWPLTIIMTPEGKPFFAATYIPRENAFGRAGMLELLPELRELWKSRRGDVAEFAESVAVEVGKLSVPPPGGFLHDATVTQRATAGLAQMFDRVNGGFGSAPKFPQPLALSLLLRSWLRDGDAATLKMVEQTLVSMRNGGIYDQLGFGFHRYATDARWGNPHFEKMLYDQALLSLAYTEAWQATGREFYAKTAKEIFAYTLRDLALPGGGFASAEDADSEGVEGAFYLWSAAEARAVLGDPAFATFRGRYDVRDEGNFDDPEGKTTGKNVLRRAPADLAPPGPAEAKLLAARGNRTRPTRDDKLLADWNGLMIAALARAGRALEEPVFTRAAEAAARFVFDRMRSSDGRLLHRFRDGEAAIPGFADDHAFMTWGLLELYETTFDVRYLRQAIDLVRVFVEHFWNPSVGGFYDTADDMPGSVARSMSFEDDSLPSANSVALLALLRLNRMTGNPEYETMAEAIALRYPPHVVPEAIRYASFLSAMDFSQGPSFEVVIAGDPAAADTRAMLRALRRRLIPNMVVILRPTDAKDPEIVRLAPFTEFQVALDGKATAYVCRDFACSLPTTDIAKMLSLLGVK